MSKKYYFIIVILFIGFFKANAQVLDGVLDSLHKELSNCKADTSKAKILDALSYTYSKVDPDQGLIYATRLKKLSIETKNNSGLARANIDLGLNYSEKCEYQKALNYYLGAARMFEKLGNMAGMGAAFSNISLLFLNQSEYSKAIKHAFTALKILENTKDYRMTASVQENIGTIYLEQKSFQKTVLYYSLAYNNFKKIADLSGMARVIGNKGIVHNEIGEYEEALKCHSLALKNNQLKGLKRSVQINLANIAITYGHLNNHEKALDYHLKALEISKQINDKRSIGINLGNAGEEYIILARQTKNSQLKSISLKKGIAFLQEATKICKEINFNGPLVEFKKHLSEAYSSAGMHALAFNEYKEYTKLKDSVYAAATQKEIVSLETKRELELKDKEILLKAQQKEISLLDAKNKKHERIIYIISIVLLSVFVFILYTFLRARSKRHQRSLQEIAHIQSHEVRAPLARILGLVNIIDYENSASNDNQIILTYIKRSALELDEVIKKIVGKTSDKFRTPDKEDPELEDSAFLKTPTQSMKPREKSLVGIVFSTFSMTGLKK